MFSDECITIGIGTTYDHPGTWGPGRLFWIDVVRVQLHGAHGVSLSAGWGLSEDGQAVSTQPSDVNGHGLKERKIPRSTKACGQSSLRLASLTNTAFRLKKREPHSQVPAESQGVRARWAELS